ncbi:MAG TPA: biotin-dependent carboxyltransferase family protein [Candidatus Limnocylindria bacterium]
MDRAGRRVVTIEVVERGILTTIQDAFGRRSWRHAGVPVGGAADAWSARLANRLVGNNDNAALLELTLAGPTLRFTEPAVVALVGEMTASIDGLPFPPGAARAVRAGGLLRIGEGRDARAYLAIGGGLHVEPLLGSVATDLRSGFGGLDGRALRAGDRLAARASAGAPARWIGVRDDGPIRIVDGPHPSSAVPLTERPWRVGEEADRAGVRLDGPRIRGTDSEVPSMGLPLGAIQVPPDGRPIIMLADRPVTGGYPVPAVVIGADIGRVARLRPGDELRFASVSTETARSALRRAEDELAALEMLDAPVDDELGWAGSHR